MATHASKLARLCDDLGIAKIAFEAEAMRIIADLRSENTRLRDELLRARDQIAGQQAMPDDPAWIDDALMPASQ